LREHRGFSFGQDIHAEELPKIKTDFEKFVFVDVGALDQVLETFLGIVLEEFKVLVWLHGVCALLDQSKILSEHT